MIPQKYDLGQNTNTYFVLRTWYLVQSSNYHFFILQSAFSVRHYQKFVQGTKYNVPSIRGEIRDSGALRIPTSYLNILRSIFDISLVFVSRLPAASISYFVLGTWFSPPSSFFNQHSAFDIIRRGGQVASSKNLYKVPSTKYQVFSVRCTTRFTRFTWSTNSNFLPQHFALDIRH